MISWLIQHTEQKVLDEPSMQFTGKWEGSWNSPISIVSAKEEFYTVAASKHGWAIWCVSASFSCSTGTPLWWSQLVCWYKWSWLVQVRTMMKTKQLQREKIGSMKKLYMLISTKSFAVWHHFDTKEMLLQLHHPHKSQKNESLNFNMVQHTTEDQYFSLSMELADWNALLELIDSIGYQVAFKVIIEELEHNTNIIAHEYFQHHDKKCQYNQCHWQREAIKTQRYIRRWKWSR